MRFITHKTFRSFGLAVAIVVLTWVALGIGSEPGLAKPSSTSVSGTINSDTTWTPAGSPYILDSDVIVSEGVTLTIEPGVTVQGQQLNHLEVLGHLEAVATATDPITFTSESDTGVGEWTGLWFNGGTGHLDHATVRYGGSNTFSSSSSRANIYVQSVADGGRVRIENSTIQASELYAISVETGALHRLQLMNNTFVDNNPNRVLLLNGALDSNTRLIPQTGLEGYELGSFVDLSVEHGVTLTVTPGTTLMGVFDTHVEIQGHLEAVGTVVDPIIFTSASDTGGGEWEGIWFNGGTGHLDQVTVRNGGGTEFFSLSPRANIYVQDVAQDGEVRIENSLIEGAAGGTLDAFAMAVDAGELHQLQLVDNVFDKNRLDRVLLVGDSLDHDATLVPQTGLEGYQLERSQDLTVEPDVNLVVEPGVTVMAEFFSHLEIQGHLSANGTAAEPITFTSVDDAGPGEWVGLWFNGGTGALEHARVRYGGSSSIGTVRSNVYVQDVASGGQVSIRRSEVSDSYQDGIFVRDGRVTIGCSAIIDNGDNGVEFDTGTPLVFVYLSEISGNDEEGVYNASDAQINARYNWWGHPSGPSGDGAGSGDAVSGDVSFDPWLSAAPAGCFEVFVPAVIK